LHPFPEERHADGGEQHRDEKRQVEVRRVDLFHERSGVQEQTRDMEVDSGADDNSSDGREVQISRIDGFGIKRVSMFISPRKAFGLNEWPD
jgi:hypothetical protein